MKKNGRMNTNVFFVVLIGTVALIFTVCTIFINYMGTITDKETDRYLSELSTSVVYAVDARLESNLDTLESLADSYLILKKQNPQDFQPLKDKARRFKFENIYFVSLNGAGTSIEGEAYDFSSNDQIMNALDGERVITNNHFSYSDIQNGFSYAVPIYENGKITGAFVASNTTEQIVNLLSQKYFNGDGFFHIIDTEGSFIVKSNNHNSKIQGDNFFKAMQEETQTLQSSPIETIEKELASGGNETIQFSLNIDNVAKISKLFPLKHNGFTLILMVTENAASEQFDLLQNKGIQSNIVIALALISILILMYVIYHRHNKKLSTLAYVDPVTGGLSQNLFEVEACKRIQNASPNTYSFVTVNILKFKLINDIFGTYEGNRVLNFLHNVFCTHLLDGELISRSFADHFDVLISSREQDDLIEKLTLISEQVNSFNENATSKYYLNLSVGVYQINDCNLTIMNIRDRANVARKNGINTRSGRFFTCSFYSELERLKQQREKEMENRMVDALTNHEFVVYLQPKIMLDDDHIVGAEALVRWLDPERGLIPPDDFIPFFEKNGFITHLDLYVFEQTCQILRGWLDAGENPVSISVNLSRVHLNDQQFLNEFIRIQNTYQIPPALLEIEITETLLFENLDSVVNAIDKIHQAGFYCSLDDFGSGYSSLNMLQDIHVDYIKLDKAFFRSPDLSNQSERAIIESVVAMAKKLSMTVISEGIETQEQLEYLRKIKCGMVQGYVISRPIPVDDFEHLLFGKLIKKDHERI